ncbi:hypothetical protein NG798_12815 [Ancylothrix sp. C2]|uniref:hypothetical protein n=1 Tax=Ancylothrix sp. D3o TaxID=2953691 RepID=UPI0021BB27D6|nr:hypothetical protein [Ancylothrix sp. D3o]MCT7950676.1 hypothetical protein [Ancylothrix sp. D3o]
MTTTPLTKAYEELIEFIATGTTPQSLINFQASDTVKQRVIHLIELEKINSLTQDEKKELDNYMQIEHLMRLAKAKAYKYLPTSSHQ